MSNLTSPRPTGALAPVATVRREATVALAAGTASALAWLVAHVAGVDLFVRSGSGSREVGLASAVVTAVVVAVAGAGLLRLLERRTTLAGRRWTVAAVTIWILSFVGPLSATSAAAGAALATMHLLVGAVIVGGLRLRRVA